MLEIQQYIPEFLEKTHKISFPGIGQVRYVYYPAEVLRFTKRILPPRYKLEFMPSTDELSDDFVEFVSDRASISKLEAQEGFDSFLTQMKEKLASNQSFYIEQVGTFKYVDKKIIFEEDRDSYLLAHNMGLKDVNFPEVADTNVETKRVEPEVHVPQPMAAPVKTHKKGIPVFVKVGLAVAFGVLCVFFVLANVDFSRVDVWLKVKQSVESLTAKLPWLNTQQKGMIEDLRKMNREALSIKQEEVTDTLKTETTGALQNNIVAKPVAKQLVYHIIAGSFKSKANALECIKKLQHMGYNPVLLNFNDTLFRVSLISNPNRQKAVEDYIQITQQHPDMKIWFYSQYE